MRQLRLGFAPAAASLPVLLALAASPMAAKAAETYSGFPVTVKGYSGDKKSSVSYSGQIARHVLHDSLKKLATSGDAAAMTSYFEGEDPGRAIVAPASKDGFKVKQSTIGDISKKTNLAGKTYKGTITGMPGGMTGPELVKFWIDKAAASKGFDATNGYDYSQLISKFIMGAVSYNQAVDNYLDEGLGADKKPNDQPYSEGAYYTGKEHVWDEAFGYFGAPAHALSLTAEQAYNVAKQTAFTEADANGDGVVDLKTEFVFGPAYYAAGADKGGKTEYLHTIVQAFIDGRKLIAGAKGEKLTDEQRAELVAYAETIRVNWQKVLAEAVHKYAGSIYKDMEKLKTIQDAKGDTTKVFNDYVKHWGELKGFSLALQTGKDNLGETATRLNRLIGFGPLLLNSSQVIDINSKGEYVRDQGVAWGEYMLHMAKVQALTVDQFGIQDQANKISGDLADLAKTLGAGKSAEND